MCSGVFDFECSGMFDSVCSGVFVCSGMFDSVCSGVFDFVQSLEQELDQAEEEAVVASASFRVSTPPHSARQDSESGLETWIKHDRCVQPAN